MYKYLAAQNNNSKKISIIVITTLFIGFLIFYIIQNLFISQFDVNAEQKNFYSKLSVVTNKKIFLIGTSHVAVLNTTHIQEYVNKYDKQYVVYNLAILGDRITERYLSADDIISAKPDLIIYGIGFRDFENPVKINNTVDFLSVANVASPLPNLHTYFEYLLNNIDFLNYNLVIQHNPQLLTLKAIGTLTTKPFPIPDHTLTIIWEDRFDLQKAFPEVAQGNLDRFKKWAVNYGSFEDPRLSSLKPAINDILVTIWNERLDLQKAFPEVAQGNLDRLKKWAVNYGSFEDPRLSSLKPTIDDMLVIIWNERPDLQKAFPEVAQGNLDRLKKWAITYGPSEDKRLSSRSQSFIPNLTTPSLNNPAEKILNKSELETQVHNDPFYGFESDYKNKNVVALNGFIDEMQKNKIKIIIFTTPSSRQYLDTISDEDKSTFISIFENISKKYHIDVFYFQDKYADMNIWNDPTHVAVNEKSIIYSDDIAKIIASEIVS